MSTYRDTTSDKKYLSYMDFKYSSTSKIFEAEEIKGLTPDQIHEAEKAYGILVDKLNKGEDIDEGFFSGILGSGASALIGPAVMRAVCKVLGIQEDGVLYKLMTSKLVLGAMGYTLAK